MMRHLTDIFNTIFDLKIIWRQIKANVLILSYVSIFDISDHIIKFLHGNNK